MNGLWIGIIFLINTSLGNFGLNDEYFVSEEECWEYFDKHPSFEILDAHSHNHYDIKSIIKRYAIKHVGTAYVTCKPKYLDTTITPYWE